MTISPELKAKALRLVADFEGGWTAVGGNFDGQLLSYGPLQWNLGQKTLQPILAALARTAPDVVTQHCGPAFLAACRGGYVESFTRQFILTGTRVRPEWQARLVALAGTPAARDAFVRAADPYLKGAATVCATYGLRTERAFAFAFDRCTQQGTRIRPDVTAALRAFQASKPQAQEWELLKVLARAYADSANDRWQDDVLSRALSVALGGTTQSQRTVHGRRFDLDVDYGISYGRPWST